MDLPELPLMLAACADRAEELGDTETAACLRWLARNPAGPPGRLRDGRRAILLALIEKLDGLFPDDTIKIHWTTDEVRAFRPPNPFLVMPHRDLISIPRHRRPAGAMTCPRCGEPLDRPHTRYKPINPPITSATCASCRATTTVFRDRDGGLHPTAEAARAANRQGTVRGEPTP